MATSPKNQDPAAAALLAIEEALNLRGEIADAFAAPVGRGAETSKDQPSPKREPRLPSTSEDQLFGPPRASVAADARGADAKRLDRPDHAARQKEAGEERQAQGAQQQHAGALDGGIKRPIGLGEIVGTGIETSFEIEFTVRVLKGKAIGWPRGETADEIFAIGNARPLDQALQHATTEMLAWLGADYGLDPVAASHLLGQTVRYDVANVFNPAYSVACRLEKRWLAGRA